MTSGKIRRPGSYMKVSVKYLEEYPDRIASVMKELLGKDISMYDPTFLLKVIEARCLACSLSGTAMYCELLKEDSNEADVFYHSLHITYSRFFREPLTYALLEQIVLPEICSRKPAGSEVRIWSAGCAGGQEAYSMAMLLLDLALDTGREVRFRIFATDIDEKMLAAGKAGQYSSDSVAQIQAGRLARYFTKHGTSYRALPILQQNINFSIYDLLDESSAHPPESIYGDFDLVMCSNLLIYYTIPYQHTILNKLFNSLSASGYLVTGETERALVGNMLKQQIMTPTTAIFRIGKKRGKR